MRNNGGCVSILSGWKFCRCSARALCRHDSPLHDLIDRIPEEELAVAKRFLEYLSVSPAYRAALLAPEDDEPVTESDAAAISRANEQVRAGKIVPHDDVMREFGLLKALTGWRGLQSAGRS